jgi:class 3 adenylate cyclase
MDPRLAGFIDELGPDRWAAFAVDASNTLVWVSQELKDLISARSDEDAGVGEHVVASLFHAPWAQSIAPDSQLVMFGRAIPYLLEDGVPDEVLDAVPQEIREVVAAVTPTPQPALWAGSFDFAQDGLPTYPVEYVVVQLRDREGERIGTVMLSNMGLRPTLLARLGRGDAAMYERMARLTDPSRHATAILFADLEGSGELSRRLPTASYFNLIRSLTSTFDALVAERRGIVGKHAGDGWTAFFLAEDAGGPSRAAAAALAIARELQQHAASLDAELPARGDSPAERVRVNAGVHWGPGVYLGQLVPGGRLEVTALGDEVNECARIQECARGGSILASKQVMELLEPEDVSAADVDLGELRYESLAGMPAATDKTRRDAATVAVTAVI